MGSSNAVQCLLDALLWDIYGKVSSRGNFPRSVTRDARPLQWIDATSSWKYSEDLLWKQSIRTLTEISASLRIEIRIIGNYLTRVLIGRDKNLQKQQVLCDIISAYLKALSQPSVDAKNMRFSLSPPHPFSSGDPNSQTDESTTSSDFDQWLHAMKMVARLPGGMPPEFRKKLWLALSEKYLQTRNVDWEKEQAKCFSEQWREDDEELGIQIVKDLHRTGSSLCSGPAGSINQAKLKRVLLGYARWNPEVGYCQGFNMLGALILQVMDKNEVESMKVMIFLVEGVLPPGYFSGSLGGLQADMAVFREIMTSKLPKLAKHLQRLQGRTGEDSFEPPLTNVFTMQWFLTLFCTCLPINCVLRVWDLVLIEGSDVLLRTALAIWCILEDKILCAKTADDFYCKMGILSGELLNGHLVDSNGLIEKVVDLGPVPELQKLRDKHLYNIAPWRDKKNLRLYYSDDEGDSDDDSRLAVTTAWGLRLNRRGSMGLPTSSKATVDNKDRLALDISLLKKQYDRLRERQRQAHIILTAAVARQAVNPTPSSSIQMNQLLIGRSAIVTNKGRRIGPPQGAIPPARKVVGTAKSSGVMPKQTKRGETLLWRDTDAAKRRKGSIKWKDGETPSFTDTESIMQSSVNEPPPPPPLPRSRRKSESSSYSEDSDANSSTSTSLCDEDDNENLDTTCSSLEASPLRKLKSPEIEVPKEDDELKDINKYVETLDNFPISTGNEQDLDSTTIGQIPVIELTDTVNLPKNDDLIAIEPFNITELAVDEDSSTECDRFTKAAVLLNTTEFPQMSSIKKEEFPPLDNRMTKSDSSSASMRVSFNSPADKSVDYLDVSKFPLPITSTSQLSPIADISKYLSASSISPLKTPTSFFDYSDLMTNESEENSSKFDVSEEGVTNEYFERINLVERPTQLNLFYSLNDDKDMDFGSKSNTTTPGKVSPSPSDVNEEQSQKVIQISEESPKKCVPPLCTDVFELSPKGNFFLDSTIINEEIEENIDQPDPEIVQISECRASSSVGSIFPHSISKEKSFSFDVSTAVEKQELRPTSCPEARASIVESKTHSDRVLKIIEENSLILHRILRKSIPLTSPTYNKENCDKMSPECIEQNNKISEGPVDFKDNENLVEESYKSSSDFLLEFNRKNEFVVPKEENDSYITSRPHSRILDLSNFQLRSDDNIADRLASIKNTIKSIDSLCDAKEPFKKDKCQRYIDSLFNETKEDIHSSPLSPPCIKINEASSPGVASETVLFPNWTDDTFSSRAHFTRSFKREISPRRRRDEDKEEYESRSRRDKMPKYFNSSEGLENNAFDKTSRLDEREQDKYDFDTKEYTKKYPDTICNTTDVSDISSFTNRAVTGSMFDIQTSVPTVYVPAKIELRHTTVTSTFYDRYLSQKRERIARAEKSPQSSIIITQAYLDTLKPTSPLTNRNSKSAENSPSRKQSENSPSLTTSSPKTYYKPPEEDLHVKSCDNILLRLKTSSSNTVTSSTYSPLPIKPSKPSDTSIHLGLYKSFTDDIDNSKS